MTRNKKAAGLLKWAVFALGLAALAPLCAGGPANGADGGGWTAVTLPAIRPLPRVGHTLTTYNGDGIMYGGLSPDLNNPAGVALSDLWVYQAKPGVFARLNSTTPIPPPRYGHAAAVQGIRLFAFFGHGADGALLSDVWFYDFPHQCWELLPSSGAQPPARAEHSTVTMDADLILLCGGRGANGSLLNDVWSYEPFRTAWVQRAFFPAGGRSGHVAAFKDGRMYVLGGTGAGGAQNDVWAFDPHSNSWAQLASDGDVPGPFTGSAGAVGDFERNGTQQIMITGGQDANGAPISSAYLVSIEPNGQTAHWKLQAPHESGYQCAATAVTPPAGPASVVNLFLFGGSVAGQPTDAAWLFAKSGSVPVTGPDLSATLGPVTAKGRGKAAKVRWTLSGSAQVKNGGTATASSSSLRLLLSDNGSPQAGDRVLKQIKVGVMAAGRTLTYRWSVTLPAGQAVSGRYVAAVVDAASQVRESNEANNTAVFGPLP